MPFPGMVSVNSYETSHSQLGTRPQIWLVSDIRYDRLKRALPLVVRVGDKLELPGDASQRCALSQCAPPSSGRVPY